MGTFTLRPISHIVRLQGSCIHGKPGKVMEFEIAFSRPGKVMKNVKSGRCHGIIMECHPFMQHLSMCPF